MKKFLLLALVFSVMVTTAPALADDGFYVVALGGVGTKITSLPYTINGPGFYYLGGNLTATEGNGITISKDGVTLDLMGFCLNGNSSGTGIYMSGRKNVEIRNGTLRGWSICISDANPMEPSTPFNDRIINIRAEGNGSGIFFYGKGHLIKGCSFLNNTAVGINVQGAVSGNQVYNCPTGIINGLGTTRDNVVDSCNSMGISGGGTIIGNTVTNSISGSGTGINCNFGSVIGNTVYTSASGQTGINLTTTPIIMDQNTVVGSLGTHYAGYDSNTVWAGKSAIYPYGNNAGAP